MQIILLPATKTTFGDVAVFPWLPGAGLRYYNGVQQVWEAKVATIKHNNNVGIKVMNKRAMKTTLNIATHKEQ